MADHYFKINNHAIALPECPIGNNQMTYMEKRGSLKEKKSKREHLAATYRGLERRRNWEDKKSSMIPEGKEITREHLTATYWG